ncbi:ArsC family reductase [Budviciaceae bacterium BWR-B9]|uniref:ArsC family reductase n=1 Tax=Limnobaculum allomyrinae TaxID=2791986 RepID=A0ABS1ITD2_9GAMM|nr:ArsC family reductase [Limnobaculum allomyrinae]MBV7692845.1 ArsC family reductase [Limnobaculum sp. M2-1]
MTDEGTSLKTTYSLYGIKNCDTIKKARRWLEEHQIDYRFHDYRTDGLDDQLLQQLIDGLGWEPLLNTRGTTWRKLTDDQKAAAATEAGAKTLMLEQPSIIKRPVLVADDKMLLGFSVDSYQQFTGGDK